MNGISGYIEAGSLHNTKISAEFVMMLSSHREMGTKEILLATIESTF